MAEARDRARATSVERLATTFWRFTNHQDEAGLEGGLAVIAKRSDALGDDGGTWRSAHA